MRPTPLPAGPGQESVWSYPRPPRVEPTSKHLIVRFDNVLIADTRNAHRVLETSHPPVYYFPIADVDPRCLIAVARNSYCEWKGVASYRSIKSPHSPRIAHNAAWTYPNPTPAFAPIANAIAFYAGMMDECRVDDEVVVPQPGGFYGGWITSDLVGPFKGVAGSNGW